MIDEQCCLNVVYFTDFTKHVSTPDCPYVPQEGHTLLHFKGSRVLSQCVACTCTYYDPSYLVGPTIDELVMPRTAWQAFLRFRRNYSILHIITNISDYFFQFLRHSDSMHGEDN